MTDESDFKDEYLDKARAMIAKHGVMIQHVGGGRCDNPSHAGMEPDDKHGVSFTYTVGLAALGEPELIIFGLQPTLAQGILNEMALPVVKGERISGWSPGLSHEVFGGGVPALLVEVRDSGDHLFLSNTMYAIPGQGPVPALQVVFPDENGRWPWEPSSAYFQEVPLLWDKQPDVLP